MCDRPRISGQESRVESVDLEARDLRCNVERLWRAALEGEWRLEMEMKARK